MGKSVEICGQGWRVSTNELYGYGRYTDIKGTGYTISTSGTVENMPDSIPFDIPEEGIGDMLWSMSYSGEIINWKNLLEAAAIAAGIAAMIAILAWLAGNDVIGGAADDAAIPGVIATLMKLVESFGKCLPNLSGIVKCGLE